MARLLRRAGTEFMAIPESEKALELQLRRALPRALPDFLLRQRWFGGKARSLASAEVVEVIPVSSSRVRGILVLARIGYSEGRDDIYALPLTLAQGNRARPAGVEEAAPRLQLEVESGRGEAVYHDALWNREFCKLLLEAIYDTRSFEGTQGEILASPTEAFLASADPRNSALEPSLMRAEQSNTSIRFGDRYILKFYRRLEEGINPDLEIGAFLTDKVSFKHTPPLAGALEYRRPQAPPVTLAILQAYVPNLGDAWRHTLGALDSFFMNASSTQGVTAPSVAPLGSVLESGMIAAPPDAPGLIGAYWNSAGLLGRRTAELHLALASSSEDPNFRPEPFSPAFQQSQYHSMRHLALQVMGMLRKRLATLPSSIQSDATNVLRREAELLARFESVAKETLTGELIRIHGDYHLGQVLFTGSDFVIIDFEGEPARTLEERRAKCCPLQDVAGMLRSFHYAAYTAHYERCAKGAADREEPEDLEAWARYWQRWVSARFLGDYLVVAAQEHFLPQTEEELSILLDAYLLEKAVYELGYELNNRPDWVRLPLRGILDLLEAGQ